MASFGGNTLPGAHSGNPWIRSPFTKSSHASDNNETSKEPVPTVLAAKVSDTSVYAPSKEDVPPQKRVRIKGPQVSEKGTYDDDAISSQYGQFKANLCKTVDIFRDHHHESETEIASLEERLRMSEGLKRRGEEVARNLKERLYAATTSRDTMCREADMLRSKLDKQEKEAKDNIKLKKSAKVVADLMGGMTAATAGQLGEALDDLRNALK